MGKAQPYYISRLSVRFGLLLLLFTATLFSCRNNETRKMLGKWRSVRVVNHDRDHFFSRSRLFLDTMGKGNTDAVNRAIYGVVNMDSLRRELRIQFDSAYAAQMDIDTQSEIIFNADSTVIFNFPGKTEKGTWFLDKDDMLDLLETNELGYTEHLRIRIARIDKNEMTLTFVKQIEEDLADTSFVTFRRQKN
jgi:hypothetical protein